MHEQNKAKQSKAKMCNGRRHVPLCPTTKVSPGSRRKDAVNANVIPAYLLKLILTGDQDTTIKMLTVH